MNFVFVSLIDDLIYMIYIKVLSMIVIFWKGKVWNSLMKLCDFLKIENFLMDDWDYEEKYLETAEKIIISPWIKLNHKIYKKFWNKIFSELNFLWEIVKENNLDKKCEFIAITWTNWKSTVSYILYNVLKQIKKEKKIIISGNFWTPLSETILDIIQEKNEKEYIIILEVSSFMLYNLNNFVFDYSMLLNIALDHVDWHQTFENYKFSKFNILKNTSKFALVHDSLEVDLDKIWSLNCELEIYWNDLDLGNSNFVWDHNKWNMRAIFEVIKRYFQDNYWTCDEDLILDKMKNIDSLEHRMQLVKNIDGIKIYDDGICTSVHSLNAWLSEFKNSDKIVLIAWWYDKGDDYSKLEESFGFTVAYCTLVGDTGKKIKKVCEKLWIQNTYFWKKESALKSAVLNALEFAKKHEISVILFSPWSASFDMFENVYDRCEQFNKIIKDL